MKDQFSKNRLTEEAALSRIRKYCAFQERCQQEVRNKLYEWGIYSTQVESMIAQLITEGFINEERFAKLFVGGKFRIKKWGKQKIKIELKKRKISSYCIDSAMDEIDDHEYYETLQNLIQKKKKELKASDSYILKNKLAHFAVSKGFESETVWELLNRDEN